MNRSPSALWAILVVWSMLTGAAYSESKKPESEISYQVPTSGKILDVVYRPEFDEWWIKCREGDAISVYSYEPRSEKWGKVRFVPGKGESAKKQPVSSANPGDASKAPDQKIKKPDRKEDKLRPKKPKSPNEGKGGPDLEGVGPELKDLAEQRENAPQPDIRKKEKKKAKWWDIRRILEERR